MNEGYESLPSTKTRKTKKGSGFRYSSKKALERSRLSKRTAKARMTEFTSVMKALSYPSGLSREISISNHQECAAEFGSPLFLEAVDDLEVEKVEFIFGNESIDGEYQQRVSNIYIICLGFRV
jgi:hypothetical protein